MACSKCLRTNGDLFGKTKGEFAKITAAPNVAAAVARQTFLHVHFTIITKNIEIEIINNDKLHFIHTVIIMISAIALI